MRETGTKQARNFVSEGEKSWHCASTLSRETSPRWEHLSGNNYVEPRPSPTKSCGNSGRIFSGWKVTSPTTKHSVSISRKTRQSFANTRRSVGFLQPRSQKYES